MTKMKAAMIGFLPQGADPFPVLESYAKIGYKAFEGGDVLFKGDVKENLKRVNDFGMEPISIHWGGNEDVDVNAIIERAHTIGVKQVTNYCGVAGSFRFSNTAPKPDMDLILREAEKFEKFAQALKKEDITFCFHNHDAEFVQYVDGRPVIELMLENAPTMKMEVDVGWVTYAGCDPVAFMKSLGDRFYAMHVKDFTLGHVARPDGHPTSMPRFTTPGTGVLKLAECLKCASEMGIKHAIIEQDFQYNLTQLETLTAAYYNMKETGYVL